LAAQIAPESHPCRNDIAGVGKRHRAAWCPRAPPMVGTGRGSGARSTAVAHVALKVPRDGPRVGCGPAAASVVDQHALRRGVHQNDIDLVRKGGTDLVRLHELASTQPSEVVASKRTGQVNEPWLSHGDLGKRRAVSGRLPAFWARRLGRRRSRRFASCGPPTPEGGRCAADAPDV